MCYDSLKKRLILSVALQTWMPARFWLLLFMWSLSKIPDFTSHAEHTSATVWSLTRKSRHLRTPPPTHTRTHPCFHYGLYLPVRAMKDKHKGNCFHSMLGAAKNILPNKSFRAVLIYESNLSQHKDELVNDVFLYEPYWCYHRDENTYLYFFFILWQKRLIKI